MRWKLLLAVPAVPLMMSLTGCQDGVAGLKRQLPPLPSSCTPVPEPEIRRGEDARVALAKAAAAFLQANWHIQACRDWYEGVRKSFAEGRL